MTPRCPHPDEWLRLLDGELTENRASDLRAHAAGCPDCSAKLGASQALVSRVAAPVEGVPTAAALKTLMSGLDDTPNTPARPRAVPRWLGGVGLAAAAAAALVAIRLVPDWDAGTFTPRGEPTAWASEVGVVLWTLERPPRRLVPGAQLTAGTAVVGSYANAGAEPAFLLAFALDATGEVHWLYPAYVDARTDPQSPRLEPGVMRRTFADAAVPEGLAAGPVRLVLVVTRAPVRVSAIERLGPAQRAPEALRARWPEARVEVVPVNVILAPGVIR